MDTTDEWIRERTGIHERRFVDPGVSTTALAVEAAARALRDAGRDPAGLELILFATSTPDYFFPGCGVLQHRLGMRAVGALDLRNACTGFLSALATADAFIRSEQYGCVLVGDDRRGAVFSADERTADLQERRPAPARSDP